MGSLKFHTGFVSENRRTVSRSVSMANMVVPHGTTRVREQRKTSWVDKTMVWVF